MSFPLRMSDLIVYILLLAFFVRPARLAFKLFSSRFSLIKAPAISFIAYLQTYSSLIRLFFLLSWPKITGIVFSFIWSAHSWSTRPLPHTDRQKKYDVLSFTWQFWWTRFEVVYSCTCCIWSNTIWVFCCCWWLVWRHHGWICFHNKMVSFAYSSCIYISLTISA